LGSGREPPIGGVANPTSGAGGSKKPLYRLARPLHPGKGAWRRQLLSPLTCRAVQRSIHLSESNTAPVVPGPVGGVNARQDAGRQSFAAEYHARTVHALHRYAAGPQTLDWDAQPNPFRHYESAQTIELPHVADALGGDGMIRPLLARPLAQLSKATPHDGAGSSSAGCEGPAPASLLSLGVLLELSLGITAWKSLGPDRWAVRANPSSGNLHPVEAYVLVHEAFGLQSGVYHYESERHRLARRARWGPVSSEQRLGPRVWIALSTVPWRETWKYGERAFRYCQLDVGHALAALDVAAAALNWSLREQNVGWQTLQGLLGLDRERDFPPSRRGSSEHEEAETLYELDVGGVSSIHEDSAGRELARCDVRQLLAVSERFEFFGQASQIDPHPMYSWPIIDRVLAATRWASPSAPLPVPVASQPAPARRPEVLSNLNVGVSPDARAADVILSRRSAQRFDRTALLPFESFVRIVGAALQPSAFGNDHPLGFELALWVHRVEALEPGLYWAGPRGGSSVARDALSRGGQSRPVNVAERFELDLLAPMVSNQLSAQARVLHCHQELAGSGAFALGMIVDRGLFDVRPDAYRHGLRAAGRVGHSLYLAAEVEGQRGTAIGCFFDEAVAEALGLSSTPLRTIYHFCVGSPLHDPRIETSEAYPVSSTHSPA